MDDKKIDFLQVTRKTSNQLSLISTQLKMAEVVGTIYQERPNYTINELVADIGGSLGLVLGLSMIDMLVFGRAVFRIIQRKCHAILSSRHQLCNFIFSKDRRYLPSFRNRASTSSVAKSVDELERSPGIAKRPILYFSNV
ncbi:unnamed protein product [Oikopleura dioica]|uniref:Uncharacterized protein n=1 Tax=Oikopleura dioica TaxID=34765 RepID=E4XWF9_OIKDI|nr:unnamed protein product [Oikopleura dioica]